MSAHRLPANRAPQVSEPDEDQAGEPGPHAADPPALVEREQRDRHVDRGGGEHPPHQEAGVAGADQDPVEREHRAVERASAARSSHQISCAWSITAASLGERARDHVAEREQHEPEQRAGDDRPADHPQRRRAGAGRVAGAEHAARPSPGRRSRARRARARGRRTAGTRSGARRARPAPTRASTAEATRNEPSSAVGAHGDLAADPHQRPDPRPAAARCQPARSWTATNAAPIPACAITVPHAEPARPQPKP